MTISGQIYLRFLHRHRPHGPEVEPPPEQLLALVASRVLARWSCGSPPAQVPRSISRPTPVPPFSTATRTGQRTAGGRISTPVFELALAHRSQPDSSLTASAPAAACASLRITPQHPVRDQIPWDHRKFRQLAIPQMPARTFASLHHSSKHDSRKPHFERAQDVSSGDREPCKPDRAAS